MRKIVFPLFFLLLFHGCSNHTKSIRIGVDETWAPLDLQEMQAYINGYVDQFLLNIAEYSGVEFEKVSANSDTLMQGLKKGQYDLVLSSFPPYPFNMAKFDFSESFLNLGPVFVTSIQSSKNTLQDFSNFPVGILAEDRSVLILEKDPTILIRTYSTLPEILDAVVAGEIEAALISRLDADRFVENFYSTKLKISSQSLNNLGIRAIGMKNKSDFFISLFDKNISRMQKRQLLTDLQKKWNL